MAYGQKAFSCSPYSEAREHINMIKDTSWCEILPNVSIKDIQVITGKNIFRVKRNNGYQHFL